MNIQVRVMEAQARRALQQVRRDIEQVQAAQARNNSSMGGAAAGMTRFGSQAQWAGRQLQYNFTLPLALAGGAAAKFALDNEAAMVRVTKVYGDLSMSTEQATSELKALEGAFEALSNKFGVHQAEVIGIAGEWAAAGASGLALAEATKLTLETMILGELDAVESTQALIAIQAQYRIGVGDLSKAIDVLNMSENETGAKMGDLIESMERSAGVARSAGIDIEHLAAMTAALVPASGEAGAAGNGLKTMISRILSPTKEGAEVMKLMGHEIDQTAWNSLTATDRLELLADSFVKLGGSQQQAASAAIASRWQINRFGILMEQVASDTGYYAKSLDATVSPTANLAQKTKELNAVLESNPQKLKQMWVILQNAMADIIQPLIPVLVYLASVVARAMQAFQNMDPALQKFILAGLALLAITGPLLRYFGAFAVLLGYMSAAFHVLAPVVGAAGTMFTNLRGRVSAAGSAIRTGFMAVMTGLSNFVRAILAPIPAIFGLMVTGIRMAFTGLWAVTRLGFGVMLPIATAALGGLQRMVYSVFTVAIPAAVAAGGRLMGILWTGAVMTVTRIQMALATMMSATGPGLMVAMQNVMHLVTGAVIAGGVWISRAWAAVQGAMAAITTTFGVLMSALHTAIQTRLAGIWVAGGTILTTIQTAMQTTWVRVHALGAGAISTVHLALRTRLIAIWVALGGGLRAAAVTMWRGTLAVFTRFGGLLVRAVTGPIGLAITAGLALILAFRSQIADLWRQIVGLFSGGNSAMGQAVAPLATMFNAVINAVQGAFNRLPQGIQNALLAVVRIVKAAALAVYDWFSWMNPFQRHSPSLVESVTWGMAEISKQYASVGNAGSVFKKAADDLREFKTISASFQGDEWAPKRIDVATAAPKALPSFDANLGNVRALNKLLAEQAYLVRQQEVVVGQWEQSLNAATSALDAQKKQMEAAQNQLTALTEAYDAHQAAMDAYASSAIVGQGAASDAAFENELAQKRLRLELLKLGDQDKTKTEIDDIGKRMSALQGDIEKLRGTSNDLRAAGAGSDVLGPINAQIKQMEKAYDKMGQQLTTPAPESGPSQADKLTEELERLKRQGEILDLENALKFDPLLRQIEKVADQTKELTFQEIVDGIKNERAAMAALKPSIDQATKAVQQQELAVGQLEAARDAVSAGYDRERAALQTLQDEYDFTASSIREIEDALNDMASAATRSISDAEAAARAAKEAAGGGAGMLSPGAQNFLNAEGSAFPQVGGDEIIGRLTEGDETAMIEQFTKDIAAETAGMFDQIDMFGGIKDKWNAFTAWWGSNVTPAWNDLVSGFGNLGANIDLSGFADRFNGIWDKIKAGWQTLVDLFGPQLSEIWNKIKEGVASVTGPIGDELKKWGELVEPFKQTMTNVWQIIKVAATVVFGAIVAVISTAFSIIGNVIRPVIQLIGGVFKGLLGIVRAVIKGVMGIFNGLVDFLKGMFTIVVGIFTGNWSKIGEGVKQAFGGVVDMISSAFGAVGSIIATTFETAWTVIKAAGEIIWGIVSGLVEGVVDFFTWLWDVLVGHSIIPDTVNQITAWFVKMKDWVIQKVKDLVDGVIKWFKDLWTALSNRVTDIYNSVTGKFSSLWTALKNTVLNIYNSVNNKFNEIKNAMANRISEAYTSVTGKFSSLWTGLKNAVLNIYNSVSGKFTEIKNAMANRISEAYTSVTGKFSSIKSGVEGTINTFRNNVADKFANIRDTMLGAFNYVKDKVGGVFNSITSSIKGGVNSGITAINKLISGLNKVADVLPGLDWNISLIPHLAQGGAIPNQRVGSGFATNKTRAIVGEGSNTHKEYVIPTDPRYRKRAVGLLQGAASDMGIATDDPGLGFGTGGWGILGSMLGGAKDLLKEGADWVKTTAQGAVSTIFRPFKDTAINLADMIPWNFGKKTAKAGVNNMWEWATGSDEAFRTRGNEAVEIQKAAEAAKRKWSRPMTAYRLSSPFGFRKHPITGVTRLHAGMDMAAPSGTNIYAAAAGQLTRYMSNVGLGNHVKIDHGAGIRTQYGHMSSFVGDNRSVASGELIGKVGSTGASTGPHLHFEVYNMGVPIDPRPFMAARGVPLAEALSVGSRPGMAGGPGKHAALAEGGIVRRRPGGIMANIGEGRNDEAVLPLPSNWKSLLNPGAGRINNRLATLVTQRLIVAGPIETKVDSVRQEPTVTNNTYNFYGDLSFPNVEDEKDADGFIRNLKNLGGGSNR